MNLATCDTRRCVRTRAPAMMVLLGVLVCCRPATGQEGWRRDLDHQERLRVAELVRNLDASYVRRRPTVAELVALGTGASRRLVQRQLEAALRSESPQMREAAVETMVRIGDPAYVPALAQYLPFEGFLDTRVLAIRLMPLFALSNDSERRQLFDLLYSAEYRMTERLRGILRRPPMRANGVDLDDSLAQVRRRVVAALEEQLDPIGAALEGYGDPDRDGYVRQWLIEVLKDSLEGDREAVIEKWNYIRAQARLRDPVQINAIQQTAARTIVDTGSVGAWDALQALGRVHRDEARRIALDAFAGLSRFAHQRWAEHTRILEKKPLAAWEVIDWAGLARAISTPARAEAEPVALMLSHALPQALLDQLRAAADRDEVPDALRTGLLEHLNELLQTEGQFLVGRDGRGRAASEETIVDRNRRQLEAAFPALIRRREAVRPTTEAAREWRRLNRRACLHSLQAAYRLSRGILEMAETEDLAPKVVRAACRTLGACRWEKSVPLLREVAARASAQTDLSEEIARVLGEIGGPRAVAALGQMAVYKGYALSEAQRSDEYRATVTAIQALGRIAGRPGDAGAEAALSVLTRLLKEDRQLTEFPDRPAFSKHALRALRANLREGRVSYDPGDWARWHAAYQRSRAGQARLTAPFARAQATGPAGRTAE